MEGWGCHPYAALQEAADYVEAVAAAEQEAAADDLVAALLVSGAAPESDCKKERMINDLLMH